MLASTAEAQPSRPKKKNFVGAQSHSPASSTSALVECYRRLSRAVKTLRRHRGDPALHAGSGSSARSLGDAPVASGDAERDCQPRGHRPGLSASSSGIRLSRIPPCRPFSQVTPAKGGSTGIPDSLDTKQVNTSGPAAMSRGFVLVSPVLTCPLRSPSLVLSGLFLFVNISARGLACGRRSRCRNGWQAPDLRKQLHEYGIVDGKRLAKFPGIDPEKLLFGARDRATFVRYRENRKPRKQTAPGTNGPGKRKPANT